MRGYVQRSLNQFGLDTSEPLSAVAERYVDVPVQWTTEEWDSPYAPARLHSNPLGLMAGADADRPLPGPYVAMIIGPSGVGKTEMVRQLCRYVAATHGGGLEVLPIALARCSWPVSGLARFPEERPNTNEFRDYLLSGLRERGIIDVGQLLEDDIVRGIHTGDVILALDGLDEIITQRTQHDLFFRSLFDFLGRAPHVSHMRIVVSCRVEYLRALQIESGNDIRPVLPAGPNRIGVHFLRLDFFGPSRVRSYVARRRLNHVRNELEIRSVDATDPLNQVMQRPLFLKLLCDLAESDPSCIDFRLRTVTDMLGRLVESACKNVPGAYTWDNDQLAGIALARYKLRQPTLPREDVAGFVVPKSGGPLEVPDPFEAVHKCPFLKREGDSLRFTHQIFYEYFVARGIYNDLQRWDAPDKLVEFDKQVVNVQMRRFLRDFVGGPLWKERTLRSYALDRASASAWPEPEWLEEQWEELDRIRFTLLQFMTEPENARLEEIRQTIRHFLNLPPERLHASYLLFNYEAVTVYLNEHQWESSDQKLLAEFQKRMRNDIEQVLRRMKGIPPQHPTRSARGRLVLRILDIALRLKIASVIRFVSRSERLDVISDPDTRGRIEAVLRDAAPPADSRPHKAARG